ncbi:hypothetical protein SISNIDRAFT_37522 [Sistotremastrum niveocremeum HHB9708]|uniref:Uncharacterized protein n=2 Tax=Sistotremastraceae TaxID=3402574 RepID=A0A164VNN3_9AGAM|nr:hypothetical protein SISNIDRAFT_37522 [Sistotremastrum niveocremeum HHB9708]KZT39393.1 hypothetical protein SISSUDRAFT_649324 [Sistotremastrum suecicum HHB10207 ss-3]
MTHFRAGSSVFKDSAELFNKAASWEISFNAQSRAHHSDIQQGIERRKRQFDDIRWSSLVCKACNICYREAQQGTRHWLMRHYD